VTRPSLSVPLVGTIAYVLVVVALLVAPTSAPHGPREYLTEFQLTLGRRVVPDVAATIAIFVPIGWGLRRAGRRLGARPGALLLGVGAASTHGALLGAWAEGRSGSRA
jgi:hypothetical protein